MPIFCGFSKQLLQCVINFPSSPFSFTSTKASWLGYLAVIFCSKPPTVVSQTGSSACAGKWASVRRLDYLFVSGVWPNVTDVRRMAIGLVASKGRANFSIR